MRRCIRSFSVQTQAEAAVLDEAGRQMATGPSMLTGNVPSSSAASVEICEALWAQRQRFHRVAEVYGKMFAGMSPDTVVYAEGVYEEGVYV